MSGCLLSDLSPKTKKNLFEIHPSCSPFWTDLAFSRDEHRYSFSQEAVFWSYGRRRSFTVRITDLIPHDGVTLASFLLCYHGYLEARSIQPWVVGDPPPTLPYTAQKHRSSSPIMASASPGPSAQASGRCLCLHHLFSVTCLQLNCGGCYISPRKHPLFLPADLQSQRRRESEREREYLAFQLWSQCHFPPPCSQCGSERWPRL